MDAIEDYACVVATTNTPFILLGKAKENPPPTILF
jgi:hypothetical protein